MKTYPSSTPFVVSPQDIKACRKCNAPVVEQRSYRTGNNYYTDIRNGQSTRNWFHNCTSKQPGLFQKTLSVTGIQKLFDAAIQHLKYPKINLQTKSGSPIQLYRAGQRSKFTGQIMITNGNKFQKAWYGRIDQQGIFHEQPGVTDEIVELLEQLSKDPVGVATAYGKLTGNCCFCYRKLEDERSTDVGYGPVCAKHYALPWGKYSIPTVIKNGPVVQVATVLEKAEKVMVPVSTCTIHCVPHNDEHSEECIKAPSLVPSNWTLSESSAEQPRYSAELSDFGPDRRGMNCPDCQESLQNLSLVPRRDGEGELTHYEGTCKCGAHLTLFND